MAVRRLYPDQPSSFAFSADNLAWAKATIAKYPPGKEASAVLPVLWRAQEQHQGWLPEPAIRYVADMLGMAYIRVLEVATFYTMFQLAPVGSKAHVQVCGTTPCMLRGSQGLIDVCKSRIHPQPHHLSEDGAFSWEEVECLGVCANAPMVQIYKDTYEDLNPELFEKVLDGFASGNQPKPGSQIGRTASCPEGGPTTLTDPALFDGSGLGEWKARLNGGDVAGKDGTGAAKPEAPKATAAKSKSEEPKPAIEKKEPIGAAKADTATKPQASAKPEAEPRTETSGTAHKPDTSKTAKPVAALTEPANAGPDLTARLPEAAKGNVAAEAAQAAVLAATGKAQAKAASDAGADAGQTPGKKPELLSKPRKAKPMTLHLSGALLKSCRGNSTIWASGISNRSPNGRRMRWNGSKRQ